MFAHEQKFDHYDGSKLPVIGAKQRAIDKQRLRLSGERTMALAVSQEPAFFMFLLLTENYITCIYISYFLLQIKPSRAYANLEGERVEFLSFQLKFKNALKL